MTGYIGGDDRQVGTCLQAELLSWLIFLLYFCNDTISTNANDERKSVKGVKFCFCY